MAGGASIACLQNSERRIPRLADAKHDDLVPSDCGRDFDRRANCALRNPERHIRDIFGPDAEFRSEIGAIDDALRLEIEQRLGSSLSRTDIGKHTAYIVLRNGGPRGFVHARTETGNRGSVELVWALDLDLTIKDSRVQR